MGFKDEISREFRNAKKDIAAEVDKTWTVKFKNHEITVHNTMLEESLTVDGIVIAKNTRKSIWSHIWPNVTLKGSFQGEAGEKHAVVAKIGGIVKLNISIKVDGVKLINENMKMTFIPWANKQAIVPFLEEQDQISTTELPDESYFLKDGEKSYPHGLRDQLADGVTGPFYLKKLLSLFKEQITNPSDKTRKATYEKLKEEQVINYLQNLLIQFPKQNFDRQLAKNEALWLFEHAADREVLKFALIIFGLTDCEDLKPRLEKLALHEELTGPVLFAINNGAKNANDVNWRLAKQLKGWGKIEVLSHLNADTEEIQRWFITDGHQIDVDVYNTGLICAEAGRLDVVLFEHKIDEKIFDGAAKIMFHMLQNNTLDEYPYTGQVLLRLSKHAKVHCHTLENFYMLTCFEDYLEAVKDSQLENIKYFEADQAIEAIKEIATDEKWKRHLIQGLEQRGTIQESVLGTAVYYKENINPIIFEKLEQEPQNLSYHFVILNSGIEQDIVRLLNAKLALVKDPEEAAVESISLMLNRLGTYQFGHHFIAKCLQSNHEVIQFEALTCVREQQEAALKDRDVLEAIKQVAKVGIDKENRQLAKELLNLYSAIK